MTESVQIYTKLPDETGDCPFCERVKAWLSERGIPFHEIQMDRESRQELYDELGLTGSERTVPQVLVTDCEGERQRIGGHAELIHSGLEHLFLVPEAV